MEQSTNYRKPYELNTIKSEKMSKKQIEELIGRIFVLSIAVGIVWLIIGDLINKRKEIEYEKQLQEENKPWKEDFENVDSVNHL